MRDVEGYHRTPKRWRPNARQRHVLDALVDGKTNPQIADGLDITPDGAKWHVSQLLAETGLTTREELASWWLTERSKPRLLLPFGLTWSRIAAGTAFATAIALVLLMAVSLPRHRHDVPNETAAIASATATPESPSTAGSDAPDCNVDLPTDFLIVTAAELRQQGLVEIGRVVDARDCPLRVSNRADRSFIAVVGDASIDTASANLHQVTNFGGYGGSNQPNMDFGFYYSGEQFRLPFIAANQEIPPQAGALGGFPLQGQGKSGPYALSASRGEAMSVVVARGEATGYHRIAFDSNGVAFLDPKPLGGSSIVIEGDTGQSIGTQGLTAIGRLPHANGPSNGAASVNRFMTTCFGNVACYLVYWSQQEALTAPLSGTLRCLAPEMPFHPVQGEVVAYEVDGGAFSLHVREESPRDPASCVDRTVAAGEVISPPGYFTLTARDAQGLLVSLVAGEDGMLYAGSIDRYAIKCPCSFGN